MCFGVYEYESFRLAGAIQSIESMSKQIYAYTEKSSITNNEAWHIKYIEFDNANLQSLISTITNGLNEGWYSLLWDNETIYIIFSNGTAKVTNSGDYNNPQFSSLEQYRHLFDDNDLTNEYMTFHLKNAFNKFKQIKISN